MAAEFALIQGNRIVDIVTTSRPLLELVESYPGFQILPLESVPGEMLEAYEHWGQRP